MEEILQPAEWIGGGVLVWISCSSFPLTQGVLFRKVKRVSFGLLNSDYTMTFQGSVGMNGDQAQDMPATQKSINMESCKSGVQR